MQCGVENNYRLKLLFSPRLNLPGKITEDGRESASYDVEKGEMYILCVSNRGRGQLPVRITVNSPMDQLADTNSLTYKIE